MGPGGHGTESYFSTMLLAKVFSCKICELFQNNFFIEHLWWLFLGSL